MYPIVTPLLVTPLMFGYLTGGYGHAGVGAGFFSSTMAVGVAGLLVSPSRGAVRLLPVPGRGPRPRASHPCRPALAAARCAPHRRGGPAAHALRDDRLARPILLGAAIPDRSTADLVLAAGANLRELRPGGAQRLPRPRPVL